MGEFCCIDIMGATQFMTSRANWDKKCCSNQRGPFVEVPKGLDRKKMTQLDAQIGRMTTLKEVTGKSVKNALFEDVVCSTGHPEKVYIFC